MLPTELSWKGVVYEIGELGRVRMCMKTAQVVCIGFALGLVATAFGQRPGAPAPHVQFARGEGVLTARDGAQARTAFRVTKQGDRPAEGTLRFTTQLPNGAVVTIFTERLPRLEVRGDAAHFGGPAVIEVSRTRNSDGWRMEGMVSVSIRNDVRVHDGRDSRIIDIVEIAFTSDRTDRRFDFAGWTQPRNVEIGVRIGD